MTTAALPATIGQLETELAEVVGAAAAAALLEALAGCEIYISRAPGAEHPVSAAIGVEAAARLGEFYHGVRLEFPVSATKRRRVLDLKAAGWQNRRIAQRLMMTERWVRKVIAESRDAEAEWNAGLFGRPAPRKTAS